MHKSKLYTVDGIKHQACLYVVDDDVYIVVLWYQAKLGIRLMIFNMYKMAHQVKLACDCMHYWMQDGISIKHVYSCKSRPKPWGKLMQNYRDAWCISATIVVLWNATHLSCRITDRYDAGSMARSRRGLNCLPKLSIHPNNNNNTRIAQNCFPSKTQIHVSSTTSIPIRHCDAQGKRNVDYIVFHAQTSVPWLWVVAQLGLVWCTRKLVRWIL